MTTIRPVPRQYRLANSLILQQLRWILEAPKLLVSLLPLVVEAQEPLSSRVSNLTFALANLRAEVQRAQVKPQTVNF